MLLSEQEEIELGKNADAQIVQQYGIYDDQGLNQFVSDLGQRMAKISHRPNLPYEFKILDTPVINAFAVPGGFVYVTRGILAYLNSEAEFAGVMGHEIGHVTARHSAKQYSKAQLAQLGLGVGSILSEDFAQYAGLAQTGLALLFLKFSRDAERQSDRLGVEYSTKVGYDARKMASFFETLDRMSPGDEGGLPGWFSTHPAPEERVENIGTLAQEWQAKVQTRNLEVNRDVYLRRISGLVYGNDPRQGYVEGNVFYHPQLRFQFPVPGGWKVNNTPSQVQIGTEEGSAAILFTLASGKTPAQTSQKFLSESKATVVNSQNIDVHGFSTRRVISDLNTQQGVLRVLSYFIHYGQNTYVFHGYTGQANFGSYQSTFQGTMNGFNKLNDPQKINVSPKRVQIKKVNRRTTVQDALTSFGVPDDKLEQTALLNGMKLTDSVERNGLLKIISD
ncbi:MAG: M48 family metalloprotease [Aliifodinibius sp.]|nr:M48 family metalloprotease [Fodinibius sp.]NIV13678.1 M48 family metalloprotease [Fodinibius sp.]NIY27420.1 M48 family metalloprotease [Fodinibius sp.]